MRTKTFFCDLTWLHGTSDHLARDNNGVLILKQILGQIDSWGYHVTNKIYTSLTA